ncbi:MAG TPA: hypothetical protein VH593_13010 [Ktedonobacteraceae bacterium]|jgi:hypothetical protein
MNRTKHFVAVNMLLLFVVAFILLWCLVNFLGAQSAPLPNEQIRGDYLKTVMAWTWTKGKKPDALGFRIYCGDVDNTDGGFWFATEFVEIPDKTARNYLIGSLISETLTAYGKQTEGIGLLLHIKCKVVAYNAAGESSDSIAGVPAEPKNSSFQITGR